MTKFWVGRLFLALFVLWLVSMLVFVGCQILPGDVAQLSLGQYATPEAVATLRAQMGLDHPAVYRYFEWLAGMLRGDWGVSMVSRTPVASMLSERAANTGLLAGVTALIAVPLSIGLGLLMSLGTGKWMDRVGSVVVLGLSATPEFLIATIAVLFLAVKWHWFPAISYLTPGAGVEAQIKALFLPVMTLVIVVTAQIARMTRAIISNLLSQPFAEMAMLKGVPRTTIVRKHALILAVGPIANVVALNVAYLVSGVVVVETIFSYPGLARLMTDSVLSRDMPVIQACAMLFSAVYVVLILLSDTLAAVFDVRGSRVGH
ncbi:ABC transporter permease [Paralcaligenes ureilyticus]|uniref:Peptide/nickel transport system permease protein n=1 Tax=Paralcaligenes ureilyticus TaxID=627131 RepID=A0A4V2UZ13_9BURK|nr:ABC transporter permease [Paralcaligenes ureilyticus]TCT09558.1 peptide/nickel transport system permease protein [Paralcaligenes ureilyticus]